MLLICISLVTNNVEHFFTCFWVIWISSLEKCVFESFGTLALILREADVWRPEMNTRFCETGQNRASALACMEGGVLVRELFDLWAGSFPLAIAGLLSALFPTCSVPAG